MCGIAGCVLAPGRTPDRAKLERMREALSHRGPDDSGIEIAGSVGLVHTRLAIVDPSRSAHQPMRDRRTGSWLTYNGEVFNHRALRRDLDPGGFDGDGDTETVLHSLGAWGPDALPRFNGFFSLAYLEPSRRRLTLARDRFGVKSLYVAEHAGGLWFASEMRALLEAGIPRRARADVVEHVLNRTWSTGTPSPLDGIDRVLPGTTVEIDLESLRSTTRHWYRPTESIDPELGERLARADRAGVKAELERTLREAVGRRLMADVPLGAMCSGGIDSSLVTAYAHDEDPSIRVYCATIDDQPEVDEGPWAREVTRQLGTELEEVPVTAASFRSGLVRAVRHYEYPSPHVSMGAIADIASHAHAEGVKAILIGEAADELFGGYGLTFARELIDFRDRDHPTWLARRRIRRLISDHRPRLRRFGPRPGTCEAALAAEREFDRLAHQAYGPRRGPRERLAVALIKQLSIGPLPTLLNRLDRNGMQGSIEMREPFLDPAVVDLALNMAAEHRVRPHQKGVLRELAGDRFGSEIGDRPKKPFSFPVGEYISAAANPSFLRDGALRQILGSSSARWRRRIEGATDQERFLLWTGEIWARLTIEAQPVGRVEAELWRLPPDQQEAAEPAAELSSSG